MRAVIDLFRETAVGFGRARGATLAAAIAYRTLFSLAPLLIIAVAVAGWVFGRQAVTGEIVAQTEGVVGREAAVLIQDVIRSASRDESSGAIATIISVAVLLWGASGLFNQVKIALNQIWGVPPPEEVSGLQSLWRIVKSRLLAFLLVMLIALFLLATLAITTVLAALDTYLGDVWAGTGRVFIILDNLVIVGVAAVLFAIIFKVLPDVEVAWQDVGIGAVVTAVLFGLGKYLIGLYLARTSAGSAYGAAGSLVVTLLWINYSAQIFLLGAQFTQVYANKFGSRVRWGAEETAVTDTSQGHG